MKSINTKKKALIITKILKITTMLGVIAIVLFILNFIYHNLYLVSMKYSEAVELQSTKRLEIVNIDNFNQIIERIENKTTKTSSGNIKNPFQ